MGPLQAPGAGVTVRARNVGGIEETEVALEPGVNVLVGENATNRTSFLQALMAGLGSDRASLKADAEAGRVELTVGEESYERSLDRVGDDVRFDGTPYLEESTVADLFAFLLESNDARQTVATDGDLRDVVMRPVDTDAIQAEIADLEERKREIDDELERRERLEDRVADLVADREALEDRIEEKRADLADVEADVEAADADLAAGKQRETELESKLSALRDRRSDLDDVRYRLETERETVSELRAELEDVEADLAETDPVPTEELRELERRIEQHREEKRTIDSKLNQLRSLVQFTEEILEGDAVVSLGDGDGAESDGDVTDALLPESTTLTCWTCGAETTREAVEETLDRLRERRQELVAERSDITDDLEATTDRESALEARRDRRERLERRRDDLQEELETAEATREDLVEERERLADDISTLDEEVEALREAEYDEVIDLHKAANRLKVELEGLESDLETVASDLTGAREELSGLADLETERERVDERLQEARTRIERLEREAVETFNVAMEEVLGVLEYDGIERIWIERTDREVREGRRTVTRGAFDLHVVRTTDEGAAYEDSVHHLSESEREVTGLVFALAGYLAHDIHERMPFVLLDSVEAVDARRIPRLLEYLGEHAGYLVVALLPEDAQYVEDANRITDV